MRQTRSFTRKQREREMAGLMADSNDLAGGSSVLDGSLPCGQDVGDQSALNIGSLDIASFGSLEEFLNYKPQNQDHQQKHQQGQSEERKLVPYKPTAADPLNQPYLPWDCPGSDQHLYPLPVPAMADNQRYPSPSLFVEPNDLASDFTHQHDQYQLFDEYQALQSWASSGLQEDSILESQADELLFNAEGSCEPLPFGDAATPDHLIHDPLLDERWAATYEGDLFEHSQTLDTAQSEAVSVDENVEITPQVASPAQSLTAIIPIAQEGRRQLPSGARPTRSHPKVPFVLAGTKADIEKARRRRLAGRRRKDPKPVAEVDWLPHGADRETKDRFLLEARRNDISYKVIKTHGRFKEAESTLRGRFRTLTKKKEDRVRDPQWTPVDIELLKEAVQVYVGSQHPDKAGISWMMVSQYIKSHGGTYSFGYNTCHRRWLYLKNTGQLGDNVFDQSWETHDDDENDDVKDEMEGVETEAKDELKDEDDDEHESEDDDEDDDGTYGEEN